MDSPEIWAPDGCCHRMEYGRVFSKWFVVRQTIPLVSSNPKKRFRSFQTANQENEGPWCLNFYAHTHGQRTRRKPLNSVLSPSDAKLQEGCVSAGASALGATHPRWISAGKTTRPATPRARRSRQRWALCLPPKSWSRWHIGSCSLPWESPSPGAFGACSLLALCAATREFLGAWRNIWSVLVCILLSRGIYLVKNRF